MLHLQSCMRDKSVTSWAAPIQATTEQRGGTMRVLLRQVVSVVAFMSMVVCGRAQAQQQPPLGRADPRDVVLHIARALEGGNVEQTQPWLTLDLYYAYVFPQAEVMQAVLRSLGTPARAVVLESRQVERMSYFELSLEHRPPIRPGDQIVGVGPQSYWLISYGSERERIEALTFRPYARVTAGVSDKMYGSLPSDSRAAAAIAAITTPAPKDPRTVELLFATTRRQGAPSPGKKLFTHERSETLHVGTALMRIPDDHKFGNIELPLEVRNWIWRYEEKLDQSKHFIIRGVEPLTEDKWAQIVRSAGREEALIFVHGFNTTFEQALYRGAQIVWDMQYKGIPIVFSWASWGDIASYLYDYDSALVAGAPLLRLMHTLRDTLGVKRVHVLAHSMGNLVVLNELRRETQTRSPVQLAELVMAAPDVDRDLFVQIVPEVRRIVAGMTLYASSVDKALELSKTIRRGAPRAGDVPSEGPVVLAGIDTIDVTAVGEELFGLNHDVFATRRSLINDIGPLVEESRRPPNTRLREIRPVPESPPPPHFWRFTP
jgi:esterase/lipase superfamily enzyme